MLLPPEPKVPGTESPTAPISKDEVQLGLLNKLVSSVADLKGTVDEVKSGVANLEKDVSLVANQVDIVQGRLSLVEKRTDNLEQRADSSSIRAKAPSQVDLETQAQLAQERTNREALAAKVESIESKTDAQTEKIVSIEKKTDAQTVILNRIDALAKNPIVKAVGLALLMALAQWLGTKGIHVALPQGGP